MFDNSFTFELSKSAKVGLAGDFIESTELVLYAPTMKKEIRKIVNKMKPIVADHTMKYFMEMAKNQGDKVKHELVQDEVMSEDNSLEKVIEMSLYNCDKFDILCDYFEELICSNGICKFDDKVQMRNGYVDLLDIDDFYTLVCRYCAKYIYPKSMLKNLS